MTENPPAKLRRDFKDGTAAKRRIAASVSARAVHSVDVPVQKHWRASRSIPLDPVELGDQTFGPTGAVICQAKHAYVHIAEDIARGVEAALSMQINKTDANDAFGLAQIVRTGWYRPVDMKSMESHKLRLLLVGRARLVSMRTALYSQIRGLLKTFGVVLTAGKGGTFEQLVLRGIPRDHHVEVVIESLRTRGNATGGADFGEPGVGAGLCA